VWGCDVVSLIERDRAQFRAQLVGISHAAGHTPANSGKNS